MTISIDGRDFAVLLQHQHPVTGQGPIVVIERSLCRCRSIRWSFLTRNASSSMGSIITTLHLPYSLLQLHR